VLHSTPDVRTNDINIENVSSLFAFEQSISLSKGYSGDDLLTITPPRWLDSKFIVHLSYYKSVPPADQVLGVTGSIFESLSFDDAFYRGRILRTFFTLFVASRSTLISHRSQQFL
jgi:hypothetical protein